MSNLYSPAYHSLQDFECKRCESSPAKGYPKLASSEDPETVYEAEYTCPNCELDHSIEIENSEESLAITIERQDTNDVTQIRAAKRGLRLDTHSARDALDTLGQLRSAVDMLKFNKIRFCHLTENTPDYAQDDDFPGGTWQHPLFKSQLVAEIHNYVTAAYTFEETFKTLRQRIPTGQAIESQFQEYHRNSRVIIGLRIYLQHEQMFPVTISPDMDAEGYKLEFLVPLDEVWTLDSEMGPEKPYGYSETTPDELYAAVDGDSINLEKQINRHYTAADQLVSVTESYVEEEMKDNIDDFYELAEPFSLSNVEE